MMFTSCGGDPETPSDPNPSSGSSGAGGSPSAKSSPPGAPSETPKADAKAPEASPESPAPKITEVEIIAETKLASIERDMPVDHAKPSFSADGKRLVVIGGNLQIPNSGFAQVLNSNSLSSLHIFKSTHGIMTAAYAPVGENIVTVTRAVDSIQISNLATRRTMDNFERVYSKHIALPIFSPDGNKLFSNTPFGNSAHLWHVGSKRLLFKIVHEKEVLVGAFSPEGERFITGAADGITRVWETETQRKINELEGHKAGVVSAAFSPDGKRIVTGSKDKSAYLWDVATGKSLAWISGHNGDVYATFSPDGRKIFTYGTQDSAVHVWEFNEEKDKIEEVAQLDPHKNSIISLSFSRDGSKVVTGSLDGIARLWSVDTGKLLVTLPEQEGWVSASFSPTEDKIATWSADGAVKMWKVTER